MESIIYNISNAYFPVTVYLKEGYVPGGAVIATNTHNFAGEYSFDNVLEGQYTILVVDTFGCTKMINTPPIEEDCEIDGFIECGLTTTTLEVTTTVEITTTLSPTTTETPTTTLAATTTIESTTTIEPTTTGTSTTTTEATTTTEPTTTGLALIDVNYGYLYNWYAAMGDADGSDSSETSIAASGWHLPTLVELQTLSDYLGAGGNYLTNTIGGSMKETSLIYWTTPNSGATNTALFNGRGTGYRNYSTGVYQSINEVFYFWTDWNISNIAIPGSLKYNFETFISSTSSSFNKKSGAAIRLIKDSTTLSHGETGTYTGNDGKVYRTICIGTQEWLADNLCETLYLNGSTITEVTDNATWAALTGAARCAYGNNESNAINP